MANNDYDKFAVGDKVMAKRDINFADGTFHRKYNIYKVTEDTVDYFNVNFKDYNKVVD